MRTCLGISLAFFSAVVCADEGDDSLQLLLSKSEAVVAGEIVSEPMGLILESGVVEYVCDFQITEGIKGAKLVAGTINVSLTRFEERPEDRPPELRKGSKCIIFIKRAVAGEKPAWKSADPWLAIQHSNSSLIRCLRRVSERLEREESRAKQVEDIREAVFRWQFSHNASGQQNRAKAFYLAVGERGEDPTPELLKRFARQKPPVRAASECAVKDGAIIDRRTGEKGVKFRIDAIRWINDEQVEIEGGYEEANLSASGNTYTAEKAGGKWKVTKDTMKWIS